MRKIIYNTVYSASLDNFVVNLLINDGDSTIILGPTPEDIDVLYTQEELNKILICNKLLFDKNQPSLTMNEINYMLGKL